MTTTISFSDLSIGDVVTNQFTSDSGITFVAPDGKGVSDAKSPFGSALSAARHGGAAEFPNWAITCTFQSHTHSRIGVSINDFAHLTAYNAAGAVIGSISTLGPKFDTGGSYHYGEFATGKANIASFVIQQESDHPFYIASLTFEKAGARQKPDFRFMLSDYNIPNHLGEVGSMNFTLARLHGSTGPIGLSVSSNPDGILAPSTPPPTSAGDGANVAVKLVGGNKVIVQDNTITISGKPLSVTAGTSTRTVTTFYSSFG